jgi:hypothetical protein
MLAMIPLCFASGCVNVASGDAICAGTEAARTEHAAALADDGGPLSLVTGARLIRLVDAGCANDT